MKKALFVLILFSSVALFGQEEITIRSRASVSYPIEKINVFVGIKTIDSDIKKADNDNYKKSLSIINFLVNYGYKKEDILTLDSRTMEQRIYKGKKYYLSTSEYSFILTKLDSYDAIKEELLKNGAESVRFQKIKDNEDKYRKQAYYKAIETAKQNAEIMAKEFDYQKIQLKKIIDGGTSYLERMNELKEELTGQKAEFMIGEAVTVADKESSITKLTEVVRVDLLMVFEVIK